MINVCHNFLDITVIFTVPPAVTHAVLFDKEFSL